MTYEEAMFILRHGSCEGEHKYLEAVSVIEEEVNRQKAEIERLNVELVGMRGACESYKMHYDNAQAEIKRLNKEVETEIDKLNAEKNDVMYYKDQIKSEAIKEFAGRLCDGRVSNDPVVIAVKTELKIMKGELNDGR